MRIPAGLVLAAMLMCGSAAIAQDNPPAECTPAAVPARVIITPPTKPATPACAAKNICSKAVADQFNASIVAYNKAIRLTNEAVGAYADALNNYARDAGRYSMCEIDRLNALVSN
ncbi:MAG: hypothetical protein QM773_09375 [Hyphomonadaceae bacterium]